MHLSRFSGPPGISNAKANAITANGKSNEEQRCHVVCCRRIYWSDCSGPATIQTASIVDGGDRMTLIIDNEHTCIVDIAIDFDSMYTHFSRMQKSYVTLPLESVNIQ